MTRAALLQRIENLTDDEFEQVVPFLEADLDALQEHLPAEDLADLVRAAELGRESARTEPLLDNDAVFAMARDRSLRA